MDGTHIKANANLKKHVKKSTPVAAKRYQEQLDEEIEADRQAHTVCDRRGYVLETEVTPGNVHDSVAFDAVFERMTGPVDKVIIPEQIPANMTHRKAEKAERRMP